jgi:hypothetical protein
MRSVASDNCHAHEKGPPAWRRRPDRRARPQRVPVHAELEPDVGDGAAELLVVEACADAEVDVDGEVRAVQNFVADRQQDRRGRIRVLGIFVGGNLLARDADAALDPQRRCDPVLRAEVPHRVDQDGVEANLVADVSAESVAVGEDADLWVEAKPEVTVEPDRRPVEIVAAVAAVAELSDAEADAAVDAAPRPEAALVLLRSRRGSARTSARSAARGRVVLCTGGARQHEQTCGQRRSHESQLVLHRRTLSLSSRFQQGGWTKARAGHSTWSRTAAPGYRRVAIRQATAVTLCARALPATRR